MAKDKIVRALVTERTFINNVLHLPGEIATVNLTELGIDKLGEDEVSFEGADGRNHKRKVNLTPGLEAVTSDEQEPIEAVEVAAVAPHAPAPTEPQGIPAGSVTSGTGRILSPPVSDSEDLSREMVAPETETKPKTAAAKK